MRGEPARRSREKFFWAVGSVGPLILAFSPEGEKGQASRALGCAEGAERGDNFLEPRVVLDGAGELAGHAVNAAGGEAVAAGVGFDLAGGLGLAQRDGEQDVVKLLLPCGHHRGDGGEGFAAGGGFIRGERAVVVDVAGGDAAGEVVIVVGLILTNGQVGQMALLLLAAHEGEHGVVDLALVENGPAGLVEILGGGTEVFVDEKIKGVVHHGGTAAQAVAVKGMGDPGAQGFVGVNGCLEVNPSGVLAGGDDLGIVLAGGGRLR